MSYKIFSGLQKDICKNQRMAWQKHLGCELSDETWLKILSNNGKYMKEARGKLTQYRLIQRFYFSPSKLHRTGLMTNNLCRKCQAEKEAFLHIIWGCRFVNPFWKKIEYVGK